jgi:hypothetical protein
MQTAALVLVLLSSPSQSATSDAEVLALGRRLSADFWAGRLEPVWAQMGEKMRAALGGSPTGLATARDEVLTLCGGRGRTLGERVAEVQGVQVYLRTFEAKEEGQSVLEQWAIEDGKTVAGFFVRPTHLTVETEPEITHPPPRYGLAALLLAGTALGMSALGFWLRRRNKGP